MANVKRLWTNSQNIDAATSDINNEGRLVGDTNVVKIFDDFHDGIDTGSIWTNADELFFFPAPVGNYLYMGFICTNHTTVDRLIYANANTGVTSTENFTFEAGISIYNSVAAGDKEIYVGVSDGTALTADYAVFAYQRGTSANWRCITADGGTSSSSTTSTAVTADTYDILKIVHTPSSQTEFFINGSSVATITTNIPAGASNMRAMVKMENTGTNNKNLFLDYVKLLGERPT